MRRSVRQVSIFHGLDVKAFLAGFIFVDAAPGFAGWGGLGGDGILPWLRLFDDTVHNDSNAAGSAGIDESSACPEWADHAGFGVGVFDYGWHDRHSIRRVEL